MDSGRLASEARRLLPSGAGLAGAVYARAFVSGRLDTGGLGLSARAEDAWAAAFRVGRLEPLRVAEEDGEAGPTAKAVLRAEDGGEIECVRIPMLSRPGSEERATLCVSSQLGCRMGCLFCETGRMGLVRDLRAAEIVGQALAARLDLGWSFQNIVFMGMGEPLDNLAELSAAISVFADRKAFGLSQERMTVCTSAPPGALAALRALGLKRLNLSISLNAAEDGLRSRLMPVNRAEGLEALAREAADYSQRRNFVLGLNYCLLPGINDSLEDARLVAAFCAKAGRCLVNLIPYNPGSLPLARPPSEEEIGRFLGWLAVEGCAAKRRVRKGGGIMAGCGQLGKAPGPP